MTSWLIIRTGFKKELYVCREIRLLGFDAWVPCQMIASRPAIGRRLTAKADVQIKELPLLPKRLFAAVPVALEAELRKIRHLEAIERNAALEPVYIPDIQISAFRAEIERENTATLALVAVKSRKQKARWRSLQDALMEMIESAKQQMEQAA